MGGHKLYVCAKENNVAVGVDTTTSPSAARVVTNTMSIELDDLSILDLGNLSTTTAERSSQKEVDIAAQSINFKLPHDLHFGNALAGIVTAYKATKLAVAQTWQKPLQPRVAAASTPPQQPTIRFECAAFTMQVADATLDAWLDTRFAVARREWEQVTQRRLLLAQKLADKGVTSDASPELLGKARLAEQTLAKKNEHLYRKIVGDKSEHISSSSSSTPSTSSKQSLHPPLLTVRVGAVKLCLEHEEWARSFGGLLKRVEAYGGALPAEVKPNLAFAELIGRKMSLDLRDVDVQIRNYAKPLLKVGSLVLEGPVIIAEQSVSDAFCLRKHFRVGQTEVCVAKTLAPTKLFHNWRADVRGVDLAYGICLLPGLADLSEATNRLSPVSLDPSYPMTWWDKLRFKLHGDLQCTISNLRIFLLADSSPHLSREHVEVDITQLDLDLSGQERWAVDGFDISMKPVSEATPLADSLHLPALHIGALMGWNSPSASSSSVSLSPHYVHPFAQTLDEVFPNKAITSQTLPRAPESCNEWSGAILASDARSAQFDGRFPTETFAATGWTLNAEISLFERTGVSSEAATPAVNSAHSTLCLWASSLEWLSQLSESFSDSNRFDPRSFHETMTKRPPSRPVTKTSLGGLLYGGKVHLQSVAPKLRFWNSENICLEANAAVAALAVKIELSSGAESGCGDLPENAADTSVGVRCVAEDVKAQFLMPGDGTTLQTRQLATFGKLSIRRNTGRVAMAEPTPPNARSRPRESSGHSKTLLETLLNPRHMRKRSVTQIPGEEDSQNEPEHGMAVSIYDMLMWCSVESRNTLHDFVMSLQHGAVVQAAVTGTG